MNHLDLATAVGMTGMGIIAISGLFLMLACYMAYKKDRGE